MGKTKGIQYILNCIDCDKDITDRPPNAYLCLDCIKQRARKRDKKRDLKRWRLKEKKAKGGSYIGQHMYRDKNGYPDFAVERRIVYYERMRMIEKDYFNKYKWDSTTNSFYEKHTPLARTEYEEEEEIFIEFETPLSRCEKYILMWCELMYDVITVEDIREIKLRAITDGFNDIEIEQAIDDLEDKFVARRSKFTKDVVTYPELVDFGKIDWDGVLRDNSNISNYSIFRMDKDTMFRT